MRHELLRAANREPVPLVLQTHSVLEGRLCDRGQNALLTALALALRVCRLQPVWSESCGASLPLPAGKQATCSMAWLARADARAAAAVLALGVIVGCASVWMR